MTSPWIGFSLAVSGMYRPPFISWVSSSGRIATRSASGKTLSRVFVAVAMMLLSTRRESGPCRPPPSYSLRSGVQQRFVRRDLHRDQVRLGRLRLRQRDRQHAEVVGRLDLVRIDRGRQPEGPLEGAIGPLIAMDLLGLLLRHLLLRALNRQQVALHRDLHVLGLHPRHLRHEVDDIGLLEDVHQRLPGGGRSLGYGPLKRRAERVVEDPAHPVLQVMQQLQHRVPLCNTEHIVAPSWLLACCEPIAVNYQALNCHKMLQCTSLVKYTTRCVIVLD